MPWKDLDRPKMKSIVPFMQPVALSVKSLDIVKMQSIALFIQLFAYIENHIFHFETSWNESVMKMNVWKTLVHNDMNFLKHLNII